MSDRIPAWKDLGLDYLAAAYGMQSAVAYEMERGGRSPSTEPKHLRVGVNSAMVEHSALAFLLIKKGVITDAEYREAMRLAMNHELATYQETHGVTFR